MISNGDVFEKTHDELDFEFLRNIEGKPWRFQTNLYGNGSTNLGREERYSLWFDPSKEFHKYSILWTVKNIIEKRAEMEVQGEWSGDRVFTLMKFQLGKWWPMMKWVMGGNYPSKPMSLYATIWDASIWATSGGKYKVNYEYAPFTSEFKELVLDGCSMHPMQESPNPTACSDRDAWLESHDYAVITPKKRAAIRKFRQHYMYYSYCYDILRYPVKPPECVIHPTEKQRFQDTGRLKFGGSHRKQVRITRARRKRRSRGASISNEQTDM
ncbi:hypothetical protein CRYUN_Cryun13aG0152000 [Craigia yunnanensis]